MVGSHDTFTYLDAINPLVNTISGFWRCQTLTVLEQYKLGVRYFDVRIKRDTLDGRQVWRCCHGLAEFDKVFSNLKSICTYFKNSLKGCMIRLVLEKGNQEDRDIFSSELSEVLKTYGSGKPIAIAGFHHPEWVMTYDWTGHPKFVDYGFSEWNFKNVAGNLFGSPIKDHAEKTNPPITKEMIDDPGHVYMYDYLGITKK